MNATRTDAMEGVRRRFLLQGLIGFAIWQVTDVIRHAVPGIAHVTNLALLYVGLAGWGFWAFNLARLQGFIAAMKRDAALAEALNDERYRRAVLHSFAAGFWALLGTACALVVWATFLPLTGRVAVQVFIIVGVCSAMIALLVFDRE